MECASALTTLNMEKPKKPLSRVLRKALGQCRRLKKRVGRVLDKRRGSYEINTCCSTPIQNSPPGETSSTSRKSLMRQISHPIDALSSLSLVNNVCTHSSHLSAATPCVNVSGHNTELPLTSSMPNKEMESSVDFRRISAGIYQTDRVMWIDTKGKLEPANKTPFMYGQNKTTPSNSIRQFSPNSFDKLDNRAVLVSKLNFTNLQKLVEKLIKVCKTDIEKARVLFRWVVETDYKQRRSGRGPPRQSYHLLYQALCRLSGLRCEIIQGYSKGAGFKAGMHIKTLSFRNCWTAVSIDDTWRLVNCTWAARHRTCNTPSHVDEFYFMTDPSDHIYQHFPDDPSWQLLDTPISTEKFIELPLLKSNFFNSGLGLIKPHSSTIVTRGQNTEIRMRVPDNINIGSCLLLCYPDVNNPETQTSLRWENNEAVFRIHSPHYDCFYLNIYAGKIGETLEDACSFRIKFQNSPFIPKWL